jgi:hypothetical protein
MSAVKEEDCMPTEITCEKKRAATTEVRFEFSIPNKVPADKVEMYFWEKLKRICRGLSKDGMKITPVVPTRYIDRE